MNPPLQSLESVSFAGSKEDTISKRATDPIARACLTWVVFTDLLIGLLLAGAPSAWLELLGLETTSEELLRVLRDLGFMLVALCLGGFFVLWSGPRRQLPILSALLLATVGSCINLWTVDWRGEDADVWQTLAWGSSLHLVLLLVTMVRWWPLLLPKTVPLDGTDDEEFVEDEPTEAEAGSVRIGADEALDEGWDADDAEWMV